MSENIRVDIELNATKATNGLARFNEQLLTVDRMFTKAIQTQGEWAANFSKNLAASRQSLTATANAMKSLDAQRRAAIKETEKDYTRLFALADKLYKGPGLLIKSPIDRNAIPQLKEFDRQWGLVLQKMREQDAIAKRNAAYSATYQKQYKAALDDIRRKEESSNQARLRASQQMATAEQKRIKQMMTAQMQYQKSAQANVVTYTQKVHLLARAWEQVKNEAKQAYSKQGMSDSIQKFSIPAVADQLRSAIGFGKEAANIASDMLGYRNALQLALGTQEKASAEMQKAISVARTLKLDINVLMREYSKFINALTLANVSSSKAQRIFEQFAGAARVLNLNSERTAGVFLALEQMVSKGTVSMEELRRQLGDHLPGALNLAAEAMGYGSKRIKEFMDDIKKGNVNSAELVEKLGELVYLRTKDLVPVSLQKYSANLQALTTEITLFKAALGEITAEFFFNPLLETATKLLRKFNELIGPLKLLGQEVQHTSLFTTELGAGFGKTAYVMDEVTGSATKLVSAYEGLRNSLFSVNSELDFSVSGIALLGTTGIGTTGILAGLLHKVYSFAKDGLVWLKDGLKNVIGWFGKLNIVVKGLGTSFLALSTISKVGIVGIISALAGLGYYIGRAISGVEEPTRKVQESIESLEMSIDRIKNNGIQPNDIIEQGTVAVTKQRVENLREELAKLNRERDKLLEERRQLDAQMQNESEYSVSSVFSESAENRRNFNAVTIVIQAMRQALVEAGIELKNINADAEALGTNMANALDKMFVAAARPYGTKDPVAEFRDKAMAAVHARFPENERTMQDVNDPLNIVDNPAYTAAVERVDAQTIALKALVEQHERVKESKKEIKNIYADELNTLIEQQIALEQQIGLIGKEDSQVIVLTEHYKYLAKVREIEQQLADKKLTGPQAAKLKQEAMLVRNLASGLQLQNKAAAERNKLLEEANGLLVATQDPMTQYHQKLLDIIPALKEIGATEEQIANVRKHLYQTMVDDSKTTADRMSDHFLEAFESIEDYLTDFITTGKFAFNDFVNSIGEGLARLASKEITQRLYDVAQPFVSNLMNNLLPFSQGGVFTNNVVDKPTLFKFASGTGLMGEAGPEAIMPLTRLPSGDLGVKADKSTSGGNVQINIINKADGSKVETRERQDNGNRIIDVVIEQVKSSIAGDIARGAGAIPSSLANTYGLNRVPGAY